jgi:hypothetical protein
MSNQQGKIKRFMNIALEVEHIYRGCNKASKNSESLRVNVY